MTKREEYIEKTKHHLDDLNTQMDTLETKVEKAKAAAREKNKELLAKLRK